LKILMLSGASNDIQDESQALLEVFSQRHVCAD
jgi:hypothetical protein